MFYEMLIRCVAAKAEDTMDVDSEAVESKAPIAEESKDAPPAESAEEPAKIVEETPANILKVRPSLFLFFFVSWFFTWTH